MPMKHIAPESGQRAFFFVVPLEMEGRWRLLREGEAFDPDWSTLVEFESGKANVTYYQQEDGGREAFHRAGSFRIDGGWLTVKFADGIDGYETIVGAAPIVPDVIAVTRARWHDDEPDHVIRETFSLIREDLADAVRVAEGTWSGRAAGDMH